MMAFAATQALASAAAGIPALAQVPWYVSLTHPLAALLFTGILAQSIWRLLTGKGVDWSGRNYFRRR